LRKFVGTLDVSAGSDLEVIVAVLIITMNDLAVDADDSAPSVGLLAIIGFTSEVKLSRLTEVLQPLAWSAGILTNGEELVGGNVLNCSVGAVVKVLKVTVELVSNHGDFALNGAVNVGQLVAQRWLTVVDGKVSWRNHLRVSSDLLDLEDELRVESLRNSDDLSISLVGVRVKLDHWTGIPAGVVNITIADFSFDSSPSEDSTVDVVPSSTNWRATEVTIDDDVGGVVGGGQFDIIDGKTVAVAGGSTIKAENIVSRVKDNTEGSMVDNSVAVVSKRSNNDVVPKNIAPRSISAGGSVGSNSPIKFKFIGKGWSREGVSAGSDVRGDEVELVVKAEVLSDFEVGISIKLANLVIGRTNGIGIVWSNFNSSSMPSADIVEDSPWTMNIRGREISIDDNVSSGSLSDELNVVNQQSVRIRNTGSFELKGVLAWNDSDLKWDAVPVVIWGNNWVNDDVVPENISEAALEVDSGSAGILEGKGELVGKRSIVAVAGRRSWDW
jgi:hypothetical protein